MEVDEIKAMLEARLAELVARAEEIDGELSETPDDDWSENAVDSESDEVLETVGNLALDEVRKIETALSRIDAGSYGTCQTCGELIAAERLKALPYASKCIKCA